MSLSILIPIYNFDVRNLVSEIHNQCVELNLDFEILLVDDFSKLDFNNKSLSELKSISYERLNTNIGRSKIRNYLVSKTKYDNCLILDCDIAIPPKFIENYIVAIDGKSVVIGGHIYESVPPKDTRLMLHWKYGKEIESKNLKERNKRPYDSFMTNSFMAPKKIFDIIKFDETIDKYGHEDTIFGIELEKQAIPIKHIDNPVIHLGLKKAKQFLIGEKQAIENLILLSKNTKYKEGLYKKSRLLYYEKSFLLNAYYTIISSYYKNRLYKKLLGNNPSLQTLNFWKFYNLKKLRNQING